MQFRDKEYYKASLERMRQADQIWSQEDAFALAMYCGGLAVECMLRAFRWQFDKTFEGRHDLVDLFRASRVLQSHEDYLRQRGHDDQHIFELTLKFKADMNEVVTLLHNNFRFATEARIKTYLTKIQRVQGIKGDPLKKISRDLIDATQTVINKGIVLWESQKK